MFAKPLIIIALVFVASALGTRFHVNSGCIRVNDKALCAKNHINVNPPVTVDAQFPGNRDRDYEKPGCRKTFRWPGDYGDVYLGADSCLYDSKGQNIDGCCRARGGDEKKNPYRW